MTTTDAIGIVGAAAVEEHLFTFLLSSPFTARTIVVEKGDVESVKQDLTLALWLSIGFGLGVGLVLGSKYTTLFGIGFGWLLYEIYKTRGNLG